MPIVDPIPTPPVSSSIPFTSTVDLGSVVEVKKTQSDDEANVLLVTGWKLVSVAGTSEWPCYVLGRLA